MGHGGEVRDLQREVGLDRGLIFYMPAERSMCHFLPCTGSQMHAGDHPQDYTLPLKVSAMSGLAHSLLPQASWWVGSCDPLLQGCVVMTMIRGKGQPGRRHHQGKQQRQEQVYLGKEWQVIPLSRRTGSCGKWRLKWKSGAKLKDL